MNMGTYTTSTAIQRSSLQDFARHEPLSGKARHASVESRYGSTAFVRVASVLPRMKDPAAIIRTRSASVRSEARESVRPPACAPPYSQLYQPLIESTR